LTNKFILILLKFLAVLVALALAQPFHGAQYEQQSAEDKVEPNHFTLLRLSIYRNLLE